MQSPYPGQSAVSQKNGRTKCSHHTQAYQQGHRIMERKYSHHTQTNQQGYRIMVVYAICRGYLFTTICSCKYFSKPTHTCREVGMPLNAKKYTIQSSVLCMTICIHCEMSWCNKDVPFGSIHLKICIRKMAYPESISILICIYLRGV